MKKHFILLFIVTTLTACTEKIDIDLNTLDQKRLVVDGWITNEPDSHKVLLTYTVDFFDEEEPEKVQNANVSVYDGSETFFFTESSPGLYISDTTFAGQVGKTYTLNIDVSKENYSGQAFLDSVMNIDSLSYSKKDDFGRLLGKGKTGLQLYRLLMSINELPGQGDYYAIRTFKNNILDSDTLYEYVFFDDQFVDGYNYNLVSFDYVEAEVGDVFEIELFSISKQAIDIYQAMFSETFRGGIFDAPPANVPSNINNGALGIFNASSISRGTLTIND